MPFVLHFQVSGRQLVISSVALEDAGGYECTAHNPAGHTSARILLNVHCKFCGFSPTLIRMIIFRHIFQQSFEHVNSEVIKESHISPFLSSEVSFSTYSLS